MKIRVLLADDHALMRSGIRALLSSHADIEVVGEAADGREALLLVHTLDPAVVVMDVSMPNLNGIEATRQIRLAHPQTRVIMLSMHGTREYLYEALHAGACGYLLKDAATAELVTAIKTAAAGQSYLSPALSAVAMEDYVQRASGDFTARELDKLSNREREVLQLLAEGKSGSEIGRSLHVSVHTADTHRRNIMKKLDLNNMADLVKFAIRNGLTSLE